MNLRTYLAAAVVAAVVVALAALGCQVRHMKVQTAKESRAERAVPAKHKMNTNETQ